MKTTRSMRLAILALAICALMAIPASAYAFGMPSIDTSAIEHQIQAAAAAAAQAEAAEPPVKHFVPRVELHIPDLVDASDETTIGEPPVADGDDGAVVQPDPTHDATPSITVVQTRTPDPDKPHFVREPDLPFTGGDATPWMLGGAALILAGTAVVLVKRPKNAIR